MPATSDIRISHRAPGNYQKDLLRFGVKAAGRQTRHRGRQKQNKPSQQLITTPLSPHLRYRFLVSSDRTANQSTANTIISSICTFSPWGGNLNKFSCAVEALRCGASLRPDLGWVWLRVSPWSASDRTTILRVPASTLYMVFLFFLGLEGKASP